MGNCTSTDNANHAARPGPGPENQKACLLSAQRSFAKKQSAIARGAAIFAKTAGQSFYEDYSGQALVSYGGNCKVLKAFHKVTGAKVAVKAIQKASLGEALVLCAHVSQRSQLFPSTPLQAKQNGRAQRTQVLQEIGIFKEVEDHPK